MNGDSLRSDVAQGSDGYSDFWRSPRRVGWGRGEIVKRGL